ncbi:hypothetical protein BU121_08280 [Staphylococcus xylosus]|nr:hypothetical protein BU105_04230 [Staphylococcus xylosus]RIM77494.1 hypothetical protein BU121_08280 [Staphylococcus xylosus]
MKNIYNVEKEQTLIFFIGVGVSISQGYPDRNMYVYELLQFCKSHLVNIVQDDRTNRSQIDRNDYRVFRQFDNVSI